MPKQPAFVPINIPEAISTGIGFDTRAYNLSDADFASRFGSNLVPGREFAINDAVGGISGQQSPVLTNALAASGLNANLGDNSYKQSRNLGNKDILAMDKRHRNYFQQILAQNPRRAIGPTGRDIADIAIANTASAGNFKKILWEKNWWNRLL